MSKVRKNKMFCQWNCASHFKRTQSILRVILIPTALPLAQRCLRLCRNPLDQAVYIDYQWLWKKREKEKERNVPQGSSTHGKSCSWPWVAFKAKTAGRALYANGSILSKGRVRGAFCCLAWTAAPAMSQGVGAPPPCDQPVGRTLNIRHS